MSSTEDCSREQTIVSSSDLESDENDCGSPSLLSGLKMLWGNESKVNKVTKGLKFTGSELSPTIPRQVSTVRKVTNNVQIELFAPMQNSQEDATAQDSCKKSDPIADLEIKSKKFKPTQNSISSDYLYAKTVPLEHKCEVKTHDNFSKNHHHEIRLIEKLKSQLQKSEELLIELPESKDTIMKTLKTLHPLLKQLKLSHVALRQKLSHDLVSKKNDQEVLKEIREKVKSLSLRQHELHTTFELYKTIIGHLNTYYSVESSNKYTKNTATSCTKSVGTVTRMFEIPTHEYHSSFGAEETGYKDGNYGKVSKTEGLDRDKLSSSIMTQTESTMCGETCSKSSQGIDNTPATFQLRNYCNTIKENPKSKDRYCKDEIPSFHKRPLQFPESQHLAQNGAIQNTVTANTKQFKGINAMCAPVKMNSVETTCSKKLHSGWRLSMDSEQTASPAGNVWFQQNGKQSFIHEINPENSVKRFKKDEPEKDSNSIIQKPESIDMPCTFEIKQKNIITAPLDQFLQSKTLHLISNKELLSSEDSLPWNFWSAQSFDEILLPQELLSSVDTW